MPRRFFMADFVFFVFVIHCFMTSTDASLTPAPYLDACPGSPAEFTCTVVDDHTPGATFWSVNATDCNLEHRDAPSSEDCGPFQLALQSPVGYSYTSVLSTDSVTVDVNNTVIECRGPLIGNIVGSSTLRLITPPTAPSFLPLPPSDFTGQDSSLQVTLHWTEPVVYPQSSDGGISRYVITSDQDGTCGQGGCVVSRGDPGFSQREYTLGNLPLRQDYTFRVRADNCEQFQTGMESEGLLLSLQLPDMPMCDSVPVYDNNNQLRMIETNWTSVVAPANEVAPGLSGDVTNYVLRIAEVAQFTEVLDVNEVCEASDCSYHVDNTFAGDSDQYTVILQARNIVGTGLQRECGTIDLVNTIVDVSPQTTDASSPVVQCVFSQLDHGSVASCTVCFGTDQSNLVNCSTSEGSTGERQVTVTLPPLLTTTRYFYRTEASIDGSIVAAVEGTFSTECDSADLGGINDPILNQRCSSTSAGSVTIPDGVVCYTGTSAGSTATYQCGGSYIVFSGDDTRTCQSDGNWDGTVQTCVFVGLLPWHVALTVLGAISWVAAVVLTVVGLVLILCARKPESLFWWHWLYVVLLFVNVVLLLVSAALWIVFGAVVDNPRGYAAVLTDYLILRDALCGVTFALSLVALILVIFLSILTKICNSNHNQTGRSRDLPLTTSGETYAMVNTGQSKKEKIELKQNLAYGPAGQKQAVTQGAALGVMYDEVNITKQNVVGKIELKTNLAYGPGQNKTGTQTVETDSDGYEEV